MIVLRSLAIGVALTLLGVAWVCAFVACSIERVVLYETVNYPTPRPS